MPIEQQANHTNRLRESRRRIPTNPVQTAKKAVNKLSLGKYIDLFIDWLYVIALSAAFLKDLFDLIGIGSLPGIGTVFTILTTITIWFVMIITGSAFKAIKQRRLIKRYGAILGVTMAEILFGLNFLPIETLLVVYIYLSVLEDRKDQKEQTLRQSESRAYA